MAMNKLTKRWLYNNFAVILAILIALVIVFSYGIQGYMYASVRQLLLSRISVIDSLMSSYAEDPSADFTAQVRSMIENFEYKEIMELMAIDVRGNVIITSSGFEPQSFMVMPDYQGALLQPEEPGEYTGMLGDEKIMAITQLSDWNSEQVSAIRLIVSLTLVDQQIIILIIAITLVAMLIMLLVIYTSTYFINSLIIPIEEVRATAGKIAQGNLKVRLQKKNDDEIGELCDVIIMIIFQ